MTETRQKLDEKKFVKLARSYLCLQRFDKFWIWSACIDRKRKKYESAENCLKCSVKPHLANLFSVGFSDLKPTVGQLATPLMLMGFWRAPLKSRHFNFRLTRRKSGLVRLLWNERRTRDPMSASRWFYLGSEQTILCDTVRQKPLWNRH